VKPPGEDARRPRNAAVPEQKYYANKAGWLVVGEWCDRQAEFGSLGRKLSIGRRRAEGVG
jgi:hypothetical protein